MTSDSSVNTNMDKLDQMFNCKVMKRNACHFVCMCLLTLAAFLTYYMYKHIIFNNGYVCKLNEQKSTNAPDSLYVKRINVSSKFLESLDNTTENKCKDYMGNVPNVIIQYGPGRTATTLQFQILCVMMALLHENNSHSVGCYFHRQPAHNFSVIKTHSIDFLLKSLPKKAWIFMTARVNQSKKYKENKQKIEQQNRTIRYIVDTGMVSRRGHFIAYDYQSIFGISGTQMTQIVTYLRYWDILRRCCGKQMSTDWRNHLSPIPHYKQHYGPNNTTYPACEMYNISEVEQLFINTFVYKRFTSVISLRDTIGKPSTVDGKLNGHYCERCNRNIAKRRLHRLNDNCS